MKALDNGRDKERESKEEYSKKEHIMKEETEPGWMKSELKEEEEEDDDELDEGVTAHAWCASFLSKKKKRKPIFSDKQQVLYSLSPPFPTFLLCLFFLS